MFDPYNLLSYNSLRFWVYPEGDSNPANTNPDSLDIIFRIGADSLNYYQVRHRVPVRPYNSTMSVNNWIEIDYLLQDMIALKLQNPDALADSLVADNKVYYYKGRPTLTNIRDIYLGVYNPHDHNYVPYTGTVYFNDMRVVDPYQDLGVASRISLNTSLADLATLNIDYEDKSENFNPVIQRGRQNTYTRTQSFNITNKVFLSKFLPTSWNLDMPLSLSRNYTLGIPRYRANSDLLRKNIDNDQEREREKNESLMYSADFGLSQRTAPKNKILLYTLYRTSISARYENSLRYAPTTVDTTLSYRGTLNYNLSLPSNATSLAIYKNYRLGYLPNTWNNSFTYNNTQPKGWNWEKRDTLSTWYPRAQTLASRLLTTDNNVSWAVLSDLTATARYNTKRDFLQKKYVNNVNIGKMNEFVQDLGLNFTPNYLPQIFTVNASVTARFSDTQRKYYENGPNGQVEVFQSDGNTNRGIRVSASLQNSSLLSAWAQKLKSRRPRPTEETEVKPKDGNSTSANPVLPDTFEELKKLEDQRRIDEEKKNSGYKFSDEELKAQEKLLAEQEQIMKDNNISEEEMKAFAEKQQYLDEKNKSAANVENTYMSTEGESEEKKEMDDSDLGEETKVTDTQPDIPKTVSKPKSAGFGLTYGVVSTLARLKNITTSYQNGYVMNYTRKTESLPFAFQIGLPHSVPTDFLDATTDDNTITFGSGLTISRNIDSVLNYSYTTNKRFASASSQSIGYTFPDVTLTLMNFESWFGMQKYISGTRINTGFQNTVRKNGDVDWVKPKQETNTVAFNPVIGFSGSIIRAINTNLSFSMTRTENITDMDSYQIIKTSNSKTMNGNISYSFRSGRGFTIPFTKRKIHINNELSSSLAIAYDKSFDETQGRETSQVDRSTTRLAFTPGATYQFDQNIRGGLTSSYEITTDKKRDDATRMFSLGIWVEVNL